MGTRPAQLKRLPLRYGFTTRLWLSDNRLPVARPKKHRLTIQCCNTRWTWSPRWRFIKADKADCFVDRSSYIRFFVIPSLVLRERTIVICEFAQNDRDVTPLEERIGYKFRNSLL